MWARAMYTYDRVAKNIGPKKEALAQAEGELVVVQTELGKKQEALRKVKDWNWWRCGAVKCGQHAYMRENMRYSLQLHGIRPET